MPAAWYKAAGGKALVMLQDVRWNTMEHSLESYLQNWPIILQVCEKHRDEIDIIIIYPIFSLAGLFDLKQLI